MNPMDRKTWVRYGALAGLLGACAVLGRREEKFVCSNRCGQCVKFERGKCGLGLK